MFMIFTIVPLGNPGKEYESTRHNAGRVVLSYIEEDVKNILACEVFVPTTFMNESGKAVSEYLKYHEDRELIVVYDDKDLPIGSIRISYDRGDGGHNGVKSIIESLSKKDFIRIRIGVAKLNEDGTVNVPSGEETAKYVLGRMSEAEIISMKTISTNVLGAIKMIAEVGYQKAMEVFNRSTSKGEEDTEHSSANVQ